MRRVADTQYLDINGRFDHDEMHKGSWISQTSKVGGYRSRDCDLPTNIERSERYLIQVDQSVYEFDTRKAQAALEPLKQKCSVPR